MLPLFYLIVIMSLHCIVHANDDWIFKPTALCDNYHDDDSAYWYTGYNITKGTDKFTWTTEFSQHDYTIDFFKRADGLGSLGVRSGKGNDRQFKAKIYYKDDKDVERWTPFWLSRKNWYCQPNFDDAAHTPIPFASVVNVEIRERCFRSQGVYGCQESKRGPIEHP